MTLVQSTTEDTTPAGTDVASVGVKDPSVTPLDRHYTFDTLREFTNRANTQASTPDAAIVGEVNVIDIVTMTSMTADRDYTLPTTAALGDRCGIVIVDGDPAYEVLLKSGAAGDKINNVDHSSTEWSRLFIAGEQVTFLCVDAAGPHWIVEKDGRIPSTAQMTMASAITTNTGGSWKPVDWDTTVHDVGGVADSGNTRINIRRKGIYDVHVGAAPNSSVTAGNYYRVGFWDGSTNHVQGGHEIGNDATVVYVNCSTSMEFDASTYVQGRFNGQETNVGCSAATSVTYFAVSERLN